MTEHAKPPADDTADLLVEKSGGLSLVWLIPVVALLIGAWLAYKTFSEKGPEVTIVFKEASGLEAGKTKVKYKDVEVGLVDTVQLSEDLSHVIVTAKMEKTVEAHLQEDTKFWVVEPQLGLGGVSGLDTLIAGHYIGVEFGAGEGKHARKFAGLEHAPKVSADTPGRHFMLLADNAGSMSEGTPIYFRDIKVGRVVEVHLAKDSGSVLVDVFVNAPFDHLIHDKTHFWQTSAIDLSMSAEGVKLKVGSLLSLLGGGITFDTPSLNDPNSKPSEAGREFHLFKDFASIAEGLHANKQFFVMYFDDSVRGLNVGAPVEIRGIRIGTVTDVWFGLDPVTNKISIPVYIEIDPDRILPPEQIARLLETRKAEAAEGRAGRRPVFEKLVEKGLRARLKSGSLVTGQLYVDLDFYPDEPPQTLSYQDKNFPRIPTLPSVVEELQKDLKEIIAKLKKLPLDKIGEEILGTTQGANRLVNSPDLKETLHSMNVALKDVHQLSQTTDRELVKITSGLEKSLAAATKTLEQLEPGAPIVVDINHTLEELAASARSIRTLTDYLERHPEALLSGKGGAKK
jgi:paraquat-inducible protein B